jgi:glucokinase
MVAPPGTRVTLFHDFREKESAEALAILPSHATRRRSMRDLYAGVDLGGTKIFSSIFSAQGRVRGRDKRPTPYRGTRGDLVGAIGDSIADALRGSSLSPSRIAAIGVGSPGPIDPARGTVLRSPHLRATRVPLVSSLAKRFGCPVVLDNDVHMALRGEWLRGAGRGRRNLIGLWIGTGIGGGIVCDGRLIRGANQNAGELGHMIVDAACAREGSSCGSLEFEASKTGMTRRLRKSGRSSPLSSLFRGGRLDSAALARAYRRRDPAATEAVRHSARAVGIAVANLWNALAPELFILGGGVVDDVGASYVRLVGRTAQAYAYSTELARPRVVASFLGDDAGVVGAFLAAREAHPPRRRKR